VNKNRCWHRRRSSEEDLVKIFTVSEIRILEEEENGHPMGRVMNQAGLLFLLQRLKNIDMVVTARPE